MEQLPLHIYSKLQLSSIILLELEPDIIMQSLNRRDGKECSVKQIETFLCTERNCAMHTAESLNIPLRIHKMEFNHRDLELNYSFLKEVYGENIIGY